MTPFEIINDISYNKEYRFNEKDYNAFMINRGLSLYPDTILYANEMNRYCEIDKNMQYNFLFYSITKKKRWSKWNKKEKPTEDIELIMNYFQYSMEKTLDIINILSDDDIDIIKEKSFRGGRK